MTEETKMDVDNEVNNENTSDETQFIGRVNWFDRKRVMVLLSVYLQIMNTLAKIFSSITQI